jgi:hypothetical protein
METGCILPRMGRIQSMYGFKRALKKAFFLQISSENKKENVHFSFR